MDERIEKLLTDWEDTFTRFQQGHDITSVDAWRWNGRLGYPAAILSAVVGTAVFGTFLTEINTLLTEISVPVRVMLASASITAASISTIQTRGNWAQKYESHRLATVRYGNLKLEVKRIRTLPPTDDAELRGRIDELQKRFEQLNEESPRLPNWAQRRIGLL